MSPRHSGTTIIAVALALGLATTSILSFISRVAEASSDQGPMPTGFAPADTGLPLGVSQHSVWFGDIDNNGKLDLATAGYEGILVWAGDGAGGWSLNSSGLPPKPVSYDGGVTLGDIDNDGNLDLAAANYNFGNGNGVGVWRGNGAGVWTPAMTGLPTTNFNTGIFLGDVNHDNNLDLAFGHEGNGVMVYKGNGAGSWTSSSTGLPTTGKYESVWMGDVNHDGNLDLAVAGVGVHVYLGNGAGSWTEASSGLPPTDMWNSVTLGDINADGNLDMAVAQDMTGNGLHAFLNDGTSHWAESSAGLPSVGMYYGVMLADLVGDRYPDLVAAGFGDTGVQLWQGNGGSSWIEVTSAVGLPTTGKAIGVAVGDIDNDGYNDIAAVGEGFGVHVWRNVVTSPPPKVTLVEPNGGESWEIGTQHNIYWTASGGTPPLTIRLEYSTTGIVGSYTLIQSGLPDTGSYLWTTPYEPTSNAYVRVNVTDSAGNYNWDKSNASFTMFASDTTPPVISNLRPANGSVISNSRPTVAADYSDASGIALGSVVFEVDSVNVTAAATVTADGVTYVPPTALSDGVHDAYVEVADSYVMRNRANVTWRFTVDTTSPSISNLVPVNQSTIGDNTPLVQASYSDVTGVDATTVILTLDSIDVTSSATVTTSMTSYSTPSPLADGSHFVNLTVKDMATPANAAFASWWFKVDTTVPDTTPPSISGMLPADLALISDNLPTIAADYSDSSGIDTASVVLKVDLVDYTAFSTVTSSSVTFHPSMALPDGNHDVYIEVRDLSSNHNKATATWQFAVDTAPPIISSIAPLNRSTIVDTRPAIGASYVDNVFISISSIVLKLDSVDVTSSSVVFTSDISYTPPAPLAFGMHNVSVKIGDIAVPPNTVTKTWWFVIDDSPPEVSNFRPGNALITNVARPLIGADYFDPSGIALVSVSLSVDSINVTSLANVASDSVTYTPSSPLAEGAHDVRLEVCDATPRHNQAVEYWRFTVDTLRPTIANLAPTNNSLTRNRMPVISANYSDASGVNVSRVRMWVDTAEVTSSSTVGGAGIRFALAAAIQEGSHKVTLVVEDNAYPANVATVQWTFTVDATAPWVLHTPVESGEAGRDIAISVQVSDSGGIGSVTLFYRRAGTSAYASTAMVKEPSGNTYDGTIPGPLATTDGVDYYIEANDTAGNLAHSPGTNWATSPHTISISIEPSNNLTLIVILVIVIIAAVTLAVLLLVRKKRRSEEEDAEPRELEPPRPPRPGE